MSKTVLIVDDYPDFRKLLKAFLEKGSYRVIGEAENGEEAVKLAEDLNPKIIIMDINMPVMNGVKACEKIKSLSNDTIVILYSVSDITFYKKNSPCKADMIIQKDDIFNILSDKSFNTP